MKLRGGDCWAGWGCCLFGGKVWTEMAAAAAADWVVAAAAAAAQVDADAAARRC